MAKLPTFNGYTMDERLKEFRRIYWENGNPRAEVIPYESPRGQKLLMEYYRISDEEIERIRREMQAYQKRQAVKHLAMMGLMLASAAILVGLVLGVIAL